MSIRSVAACAAGRATSFVLRNILHRNASQLPGRVALTLDPTLLSQLTKKILEGSCVVCGTNGKTTTNNVLAASVEASGISILSNRAGANMAPGITTALMMGDDSLWAIMEADELSCIQILPALQPRYFVLLNLFRDQLDRAGEIDRIQDVIVQSLQASPGTTLIVCGDDPLSVGVARRAQANGTKLISFGIAQDLELPQERVPEARFCQVCGAELRYHYRSYAQLGAFFCPQCDFCRPELDFYATDVSVGRTGVSFTAHSPHAEPCHIEANFGGVYMVYNLLAAFSAASQIGVSPQAFQEALSTYHPENGRLQHFDVDGREVILNLAKNPTGFNQNISLLMADDRPKSLMLVINDNFNDGKDISWIWDMDLERFAQEDGLQVMCAGMRAHDVQVRCKYAGLEACVASSVAQALELLQDEPKNKPLYVLCNYSALWPAKAELERIGVSR